MSADLNKSTEHNLLHYKYWLFISVIFIILIACDRWTDKPDFTTYLTNAATFVSLVLGLVAIIYSFISNSSLSSSLGNISKVADEISLTKQQIKNFSDISSQLSTKTSENAQLIIDSSTNVHESVVSLKDILTQLTVKTETLQDIVSTIPARLDDLQSSLEIGSNAADVIETKLDNASSTNYLDEFHTNFIRRSSMSGICTLYAMKLAYQKSKHFNYEEFCTKLGLSTMQYVKGYIVAISSAQLASYTDLENNSIEVDSISTVVIGTDFNKVINEEIVSRNLSDNSLLTEVIPNIESFFS